MKRLFGLIGLTYLSVLTVVFYLYSQPAIICIFFGLIAIAVISLVLLIIKKKKNLRRSLAIVSVTSICAIFAMNIYTSFYYDPLINKYSDKEINLTGYICDEIVKTDNYAKYTIKTEKINGTDESIKIQFNSYTDLNIDEFETVNIHCTLYAANENLLLSDGVLFKTYIDDNFYIESTGNRHFSLYSFAISARKHMKSALDTLLPSDCSSMCSAVLLGDKLSLPQGVRNSFTKTGSSFLIVVSGMHMSVIAYLCIFFIKKLTNNRFLHFLSVSIFVLAFMAVTGFTPSVVRAGIMIIISYSAAIFLRTADAVNSLGIAALIILLPNPYAVGDIGLILSFAATLGIILWSGRICGYIISTLNLKSKILKALISMITVSLSASIWVMPVSAIYFGRLSPLVLFVSLLVQLAVECLIVCSLFVSVFYFIPFFEFLYYPIALLCGLLSKYIIFVVGLFANIPFSSINSNKMYYYVWLAVSIVLVIIGYIIKGRTKYIICSVLLSFATLISGCIVHTLFTKDDVSAAIYAVDSGITVAVKSNDNVSVLCCGGSASNTYNIVDDIAEDYNIIDFLIVPNQKYKYSRYQFVLLSEFECSNILVYDNDSTDFEMFSDYDGCIRQSFGNNISFTLNLSDNATDNVLCIDDVVYQLVRGEGGSMLILPSGADVLKLPDEFRNADICVFDKIPENKDLINCKQLIYSNTSSAFYDDYQLLTQICGDVFYTGDDDIIFDLKEGMLCQK